MRDDLADKLQEKIDQKLCRVEIHEDKVKTFNETENCPGTDVEKFAKAIRKTEATTFMYDPSDDRVACF